MFEVSELFQFTFPLRFSRTRSFSALANFSSDEQLIGIGYECIVPAQRC